MLGRPVFALDEWLRRRDGIVEYTRHPDCVYRMQVDRLDRALALQDGTRARAGDRVVMLHLWNEQLPVFPPAGATIGWARQFSAGLALSLRELASALAARRDLDDIALIGITMSTATAAKAPQLLRIMGRYGFEPVPLPRPRSLGAKLHRFGGNILFSLLVLAYNPGALRRDSLKRDRIQVFQSRAMLERRYGAGASLGDGHAAPARRALP